MKQVLSFLSLLFFFSFNNYSCQKDFKVIEAIYYNWYGGIKGVRGKIFMIVLKKNNTKKIEFTHLIVNDKKLEIEKKINGDNIEIISRINDGNIKDVILNNDINKNSFFLEYNNIDTKKFKKIKIERFRLLQNNTSQDKAS